MKRIKIVNKVGFFRGLIFGGAYLRRGLLLEGILRFKIIKLNGLGLTIKTAENTKITAKNS